MMQDLKEFYFDKDKVERIGTLLDGYLKSMEEDMTLNPDDEEEQDPTVLLWLYYFTAQHNLFQRKVKEALEFVNKAIAHTPTLIDLYSLKGKIYQCGGDRGKAAVLHEEARNLDKADRAINAIAALYFLKDGQTQKGIETMDIFVTECGYDVNLHDN